MALISEISAFTLLFSFPSLQLHTRRAPALSLLSCKALLEEPAIGDGKGMVRREAIGRSAGIAVGWILVGGVPMEAHALDADEKRLLAGYDTVCLCVCVCACVCV